MTRCFPSQSSFGFSETFFSVAPWLAANTSRASHSALAARWSGGRVSMGPHGRDGRVRARTGKPRTWSFACARADETQGCTSLAAILCRNVLQVGQFLVDTGFCSFPQRGKCRCDEPKWKLEACRESCTWRCLRCRIALSSQESGLGGQKLALKSIAGALWIYTSKLHLSPNWHRLFESFNKCFVSSIEAERLSCGWRCWSGRGVG